MGARTVCWGPDTASLQLQRCPRGPPSSNPAALGVWEQEKHVALLPKHPPSLRTLCRSTLLALQEQKAAAGWHHV